MARMSLREFLRFIIGGENKEKSVFASEKEAREFCEKAYRRKGGVTPALRAAYEYYKNNYDDTGQPGRR